MPSDWTSPAKGFDDASVATGATATSAVVDLRGIYDNHACQIFLDEGTAGATQVYLLGSLDNVNFYTLTPTPYYTGDGATGQHTVLLTATGAARWVKAFANQLTEWGGVTSLTTWHAAT